MLEPELLIDGFRIVAMPLSSSRARSARTSGGFGTSKASDGQDIAAEPDQPQTGDQHAERGDGHDWRECAGRRGGGNDVGRRDATIGERCANRVPAPQLCRNVQGASRTLGRVGRKTLADGFDHPRIGAGRE
jgi:hypothetical protein